MVRLTLIPAAFACDGLAMLHTQTDAYLQDTRYYGAVILTLPIPPEKTAVYSFRTILMKSLDLLFLTRSTSAFM